MTLGKAKISRRLTCNGPAHGTPRPQTDRTCGLVLGSCHVGPQGPLSIPLSTPEKGLLEYLILLNSPKIFVCVYLLICVFTEYGKERHESPSWAFPPSLMWSPHVPHGIFMWLGKRRLVEGSGDSA